MTDPIVTDLGDEEPDSGEFSRNEFDAEPGPPFIPEDGDGIDDSRLRTKPEEPPPPRDVKAGIPSIDEWLDFWSRIVLRVACDWYLEWAFRGIDEDRISDRDIDRLQLTESERQRIAVPLAELSHKSKVMRKHGRMIVASGGVFDAVVALGTWTSRVARIARKYKPKTVPGRLYPDGNIRPNPQERNREAPSSPNDGYAGWTIINPGG
jgi:hypothetical protein